MKHTGRFAASERKSIGGDRQRQFPIRNRIYSLGLRDCSIATSSSRAAAQMPQDCSPIICLRWTSKHALELFRLHFPAPHNPEDNELLEKLLEAVGYNTLVTVVGQKPECLERGVYVVIMVCGN
ncbi:MAG: hypothetical protein U0176_24300 [Bacteroidia bacterium]